MSARKHAIHSQSSPAQENGLLFVSTLNRTRKAYYLAVVLAEQVLGLAPPGAHTHSKFVQPTELEGYMAEAGLQVVERVGMALNPLTHTWLATPNTDINYYVIARKAT